MAESWKGKELFKNTVAFGLLAITIWGVISSATQGKVAGPTDAYKNLYEHVFKKQPPVVDAEVSQQKLAEEQKVELTPEQKAIQDATEAEKQRLAMEEEKKIDEKIEPLAKDKFLNEVLEYNGMNMGMSLGELNYNIEKLEKSSETGQISLAERDASIRQLQEIFKKGQLSLAYLKDKGIDINKTINFDSQQNQERLKNIKQQIKESKSYESTELVTVTPIPQTLEDKNVFPRTEHEKRNLMVVIDKNGNKILELPTMSSGFEGNYTYNASTGEMQSSVNPAIYDDIGERDLDKVDSKTGKIGAFLPNSSPNFQYAVVHSGVKGTAGNKFKTEIVETQKNVIGSKAILLDEHGRKNNYELVKIQNFNKESGVSNLYDNPFNKESSHYGKDILAVQTCVRYEKGSDGLWVSKDFAVMYFVKS